MLIANYPSKKVLKENVGKPLNYVTVDFQELMQ